MKTTLTIVLFFLIQLISFDCFSQNDIFDKIALKFFQEIKECNGDADCQIKKLAKLLRDNHNKDLQAFKAFQERFDKVVAENERFKKNISILKTETKNLKVDLQIVNDKLRDMQKQYADDMLRINSEIALLRKDSIQKAKEIKLLELEREMHISKNRELTLIIDDLLLDVEFTAVIERDFRRPEKEKKLPYVIALTAHYGKGSTIETNLMEEIFKNSSFEKVVVAKLTFRGRFESSGERLIMSNEVEMGFDLMPTNREYNEGNELKIDLLYFFKDKVKFKEPAPYRPRKKCVVTFLKD